MGIKLASASEAPIADVVIVGGGAGGVAVALHLMELAKKGKKLDELIIIEKTDVVGPGLAFSVDCDGTILNMHSDTMGIMNENPHDYTQWRQSLEDGPFPSRVDYGQYLQTRWSQAMEQAASMGIKTKVVHQDAVDIERLADNTMTVTIADGTKIAGRDVVLALGNFVGTANSHLVGKAGYFPNPWPTAQLKSIPSESPVIVVGSRLSAVDAAIYLSENGHTGPITFMSRSGKLPKVQGLPVPFTRKYVLHELAREVEANPNESLLRMASALTEEITRATNGDWSWLFEKDDYTEQLEIDIDLASKQQVRWQSVLSSTAPVIERYWNSLTPASQKIFMEKFNSSWMSYRHAMPVKNASRIFALLKKGQLTVVSGSSISHDNGLFSAQTSAGVLEAPYVIEATGQECHIDRIDSPLINSAVKKGLLTAHPAGGVVVDFEHLKAGPGLYVMGSLTRGTHFYVSATDRVAAHASRIADSLVGEVAAAHLHVALFVGNDLFSNLMASKLVPKLLRQGHVPYVFLTKGKSDSKSSLPELREVAFFEEQLMQEHVLPYFKDATPEDSTHMTVFQMQTKYGIMVQQVPDINSASFISSLSKHHIDVGLSIQSNQAFKSDLARYFSGDRTLLNLTTPQGGVVAAARAIKNNKSHFTYSLREVTDALGAGNVLVDSRQHPIDFSKPMLNHMNDVHALGVEMASEAVGRLARKQPLHKAGVDDNELTNTLAPTKEELEDYKQSGIRLVDADSIVQIIVDSYAPTAKRDAFERHILGVVREFSDSVVV